MVVVMERPGGVYQIEWNGIAAPGREEATLSSITVLTYLLAGRHSKAFLLPFSINVLLS